MRAARVCDAGHRALTARPPPAFTWKSRNLFITGPDVKFIDIALLDRLLHECQDESTAGSRFEVIPTR